MHTRDHETNHTPLAATLERASGAGSWGSIQVVDRPGPFGDPGWSTAAGLSSDPEILADLLRCLGREYGTDLPQVTGSLFLKNYLWRVLAPVVAAFLLERRVPDLGAESVALRFDRRGLATDVAVGGSFAALPDDPDAGHLHALVLASDEDLLDYVRERFAGLHVPGLLTALHPLARRGRGALSGMVVDAFADAFLIVGQSLGRKAEAVGLAERLLAGPPPLSGPTNYSVETDGADFETGRVRNVCCLYYRLGRNTCLSCPLAAREEGSDRGRRSNQKPEVRNR